MFDRMGLMVIAWAFMVFKAGGAQAGGVADNSPGLGLGRLAWMNYGSPKQIAPQVMMATTNGTFGSQTFGISAGTSGCTNDGVIMKNKYVNLTSRAFESLAEDMAHGGSEHLTAPVEARGPTPAVVFARPQRHPRASSD